MHTFLGLLANIKRSVCSYQFQETYSETSGSWSCICKRLPKSLESNWGIIQSECSVSNGFYLNIKALKESRTTKVIQQKTQVIYIEA